MPIDPAQYQISGETGVDFPLSCCACDPSGRFLLAGGRDARLFQLDLASGTGTLLPGHRGWINALASAGSDTVLSADSLGRIIAWRAEPAGLKAVRTLDAHPSGVQGLSVSPDGGRFATSDRDGRVRIWGLRAGQVEAELPRIEFPTGALAWDPSGNLLATADRQPQKPRLLLWDLSSRSRLRTIEIGELSGYRRVEDIEWNGIRGLAFSPDGKWIAASGRGGYDGAGCVVLCDRDSGARERTLNSSLKGGFLYQVRFRGDGVLMAAGGDIGKGAWVAWDPGKDPPLAAIDLPGPASAFDRHPDDRRIAVAISVGKGSYPDAGRIVLLAPMS